MMTVVTRCFSLERFYRVTLAVLLLLAGMVVSFSAGASNSVPQGAGSYQDLVLLFDEFLAFREAADARAEYSAGAVAGREIEKAATRESGLEITVDMDRGDTLVIVQSDEVVFQPGERIRVLFGRGDEARVVKP